MMKGPRAGRLQATKRQKAAFTRRHEDKIKLVTDLLPGHKRASAAIPAVVVKAMIFYGFDKAVRFCDALTKLQFKGPDDPAHLLWLYLLRNHASEHGGTLLMYQRTLCVVKAYMEDRIIRNITPIKTDIFEWDEDYTLPNNLLIKNDEVEEAIYKYRLEEIQRKKEEKVAAVAAKSVTVANKKEEEPPMAAKSDEELRRETAEVVSRFIEEAKINAQTTTTLDRLDEIIIHEHGYKCVRVQGYWLPVEDVELDGDDIITDDTLVDLKDELLSLPFVELVN